MGKKAKASSFGCHQATWKLKNDLEPHMLVEWTYREFLSLCSVITQLQFRSRFSIGSKTDQHCYIKCNIAYQ